MTAPADEPRAGQSFPKAARLLRRAEFLAVQSKGQRVHSAHFTLALRDRGDGEPARLGVTASRKAANSVGRNRVRRLVREVFRAHRAAFPAGCDCVVIVHEKVPELDLVTVREELLGALSRRRSGGGGGGGSRGGGGGTRPSGGASGGGGSRPDRGSGRGAPPARPSGPTGQTPVADTKKAHAATPGGEVRRSRDATTPPDEPPGGTAQRRGPSRPRGGGDPSPP